jgi:CRISPR-associated Csx2 family protein
MSTVLIGFLGRGPSVSADGKRRPYRRGKYQFADWTSDQVSFFLKAALKWLRTERNQPPDRFVVLGTTGSMWDELLGALCGGRDPLDDKRIEDLWVQLAELVDRRRVTADRLPGVECELSQSLGVEVRAELIPEARTAEQQAQILAALQRHVQQGDRVYLDVTHGFRHQPMLGLGAAVLLSQLRGAQIKDILYGADDMRAEPDAPAPVVSLRWLLDLFAWADTTRQLLVGGTIRSLPRVIHDPELEKHLSDTAFFLATNQVHPAGEKARQCLDCLDRSGPDPILDLTRDAIHRALTVMAGSHRDARGILALARAALREHDYVRTAIFLHEAARTYEKTSRTELDADRIREIDQLRHAQVHARRGRNPLPVVANALRSRRQMEKTLRGQLDWLAAQIDPQEEHP